VEAASNLSTLVTIIFGLMLTDLFASVHKLIRGRSRVRWHWLPILVSWYVLAMVLKNWWGLVFEEGAGIWGSGWVFFYYAHLLLLLYLVASATLPDEIPAEGLDLREFYLDNRRQFWGLMAGVSLILLAYSLLRPAFTASTVNWAAVISNAVLGAITLSLAWTRRMSYHAVFVLLLTTLTIIEIVVKF